MKVVSSAHHLRVIYPNQLLMECAADGSVWLPDELVLQFFSYLPPKAQAVLNPN